MRVLSLVLLLALSGCAVEIAPHPFWVNGNDWREAPHDR